MLPRHNLLGDGVVPEQGHVLGHLRRVVPGLQKVRPAPLLRLLALLVGVVEGEGGGSVKNGL